MGRQLFFLIFYISFPLLHHKLSPHSFKTTAIAYDVTPCLRVRDPGGAEPRGSG